MCCGTLTSKRLSSDAGAIWTPAYVGQPQLTLLLTNCGSLVFPSAKLQKCLKEWSNMRFLRFIDSAFQKEKLKSTFGIELCFFLWRQHAHIWNSLCILVCPCEYSTETREMQEAEEAMSWALPAVAGVFTQLHLNLVSMLLLLLFLETLKVFRFLFTLLTHEKIKTYLS